MSLKNKLIGIGLGLYISASVVAGGFVGYKAYDALSREFEGRARIYRTDEHGHFVKVRNIRGRYVYDYVERDHVKFRFRGWVRVVGGGLAGLGTAALPLALLGLGEGLEARKESYTSSDDDYSSRTAGEYYPFNTFR